MRPKVKELRAKIHPDVLSSSYGCGSPVPYCLEGCTIVDLGISSFSALVSQPLTLSLISAIGSGAGVDCFICAAMVGPKGKVIGTWLLQFRSFSFPSTKL